MVSNPGTSVDAQTHKNLAFCNRRDHVGCGSSINKADVDVCHAQQIIARPVGGGELVHQLDEQVVCVLAEFWISRMGRHAMNFKFKVVNTLVADSKLVLGWFTKDDMFPAGLDALVDRLHSVSASFLANNKQESNISFMNKLFLEEFRKRCDLCGNRSLCITRSTSVNTLAVVIVTDIRRNSVDMTGKKHGIISGSSEVSVNIVSSVRIDGLNGQTKSLKIVHQEVRDFLFMETQTLCLHEFFVERKQSQFLRLNAQWHFIAVNIEVHVRVDIKIDIERECNSGAGPI
ncbi:hypothetical protein OGAPHI_005947 [Ogataea philodendri]|uniref:Uncharacterized protein n=1 Tax=Ogataea philodendri TaxID=1378263 RepID=A0A9P8NZ84_9ASCO|nr:uncharacterized protein OGAPHI_005947 [Ogataea philodendri]KAH3661769.1 hypothetical protein OGAPHI_005947 [Ogataea philodendri]